MTAVLSFFLQRRKALAYVLAAAAQLIADAVPQSNPQNALLIHGVLAVLGLFMVHGVPNDEPRRPFEDVLDDLIHGDDAPKHAADEAPAPVAAPLPPVPVSPAG